MHDSEEAVTWDARYSFAPGSRFVPNDDHDKLARDRFTKKTVLICSVPGGDELRCGNSYLDGYLGNVCSYIALGRDIFAFRVHTICATCLTLVSLALLLVRAREVDLSFRFSVTLGVAGDDGNDRVLSKTTRGTRCSIS